VSGSLTFAGDAARAAEVVFDRDDAAGHPYVIVAGAVKVAAFVVGFQGSPRLLRP
jgi:hypothetical protein